MLRILLQVTTLVALASQLACVAWASGGLGDSDLATYLPVILVCVSQVAVIMGCIVWYITVLYRMIYTIGWIDVTFLGVGIFFLGLFLATLVMPFSFAGITFREFWWNPTSSILLSHALTCLLVANVGAISRGIAKK